MRILGFRSLPNLITIGRLFLVPAIIGMIATQRWTSACLIFVVAGVSDGIDGWLARTYDLRSELGAYLDPLADKALLVSIYVVLALDGTLPAPLAILVVSRDVMIVGAILLSWVMHRPVAIKPLLISKVNTAAQLALAAALLGLKACAIVVGSWMFAGFYTVAALTLLSMAAYLLQWLRHMSL